MNKKINKKILTDTRAFKAVWYELKKNNITIITINTFLRIIAKPYLIGHSENGQKIKTYRLQT